MFVSLLLCVFLSPFPLLTFLPVLLSLIGWGADSIRSGVSKYSSTTCSMRCADVRSPSSRSLLISLSLLWLTSTCHYNLRLPTSPAVERTSSTSTRRSRRFFDKHVLPLETSPQPFVVLDSQTQHKLKISLFSLHPSPLHPFSFVLLSLRRSSSAKRGIFFFLSLFSFLSPRDQSSFSTVSIQLGASVL
jgi:hypothetical protein